MFRSNGGVFSVVAQPDGKRIIVGSSFSFVNGVPLSGTNPGSNISRLNADGTLDATFQQNVGASNGNFLRVRRLSNGQLLLTANSILSSVITAGGISRHEPLRLNADGTGDATFDVGAGAKPATNGTFGRVADILPLPNGQLIVVGAFGSFNDVPAFGIARLTATGAVDATFNAGSGLGANASNNTISTIGALPDGKFIIGGDFTSYNGNACNGLARLNSDGSFDPTFVQVLGANSRVGNVAVTPEGKILIAGQFTSIPNSSRLARLLATGAYDAGFAPTSAASFSTSVSGETIVVQADNKVVFVNGSTLTRVNADGSIDPSFQAPYTSGTSNSLAQLPNGNLLVGGFFPTLDAGVLELNNTGARVPTFQPLLQTQGFVNAVVRQADGKLLVGGNFTTINGQAARAVARFNTDGTLDADFVPGLGLGTVSELALQPDGRILVAAGITVLRLLSTGALDNSFPSLSFVGGLVTRLLVQPDGRILVGGSFSSYLGPTVPGFLRLLPDGSRDNSFVPTTTGSGRFTSFQTFALQPDGKLLVAGQFIPTGGGTATSSIARLESSGVLDESFARTPFNLNSSQAFFTRLLVQSDGKVLVGGTFSNFNGTPRTGVARLNANGSLDASFVPPAINGSISSAVLQPNGRVLIGGFFSSTGLPSNLARLLPNGQADASFVATAEPNNTVRTILIQPDGGVVIGGNFTSVGGQTRQALARLTAPNVLHTAMPRAVAENTSAWPVPAHGTLYVAPSPAAHPESLDLLDARGRTVRHQQLRGTSPAQVDVQTLPAGLYLLRVRYAEGTVSRAVQVQ